MEMKINVLNNEIFTKLYSKRSKRSFIIYHFLVESKPHEKINLLTTASVNIYQTKKTYSNSNEKMIFLRKTDETIWKPPSPFLREAPISEQFFHDLLLCSNFKNEIPPHTLILVGRKL